MKELTCGRAHETMLPAVMNFFIHLAGSSPCPGCHGMTALRCWANPQIYRFRGSGAARFLKGKKRRPETILAKGLILAVVQLCGSLINRFNVVTVYAQQFRCRTGDGCRDSLTNDGELRANRKPRDDELLFILAFNCSA